MALYFLFALFRVLLLLLTLLGKSAGGRELNQSSPRSGALMLVRCVALS
jgi:hypothetical protein